MGNLESRPLAKNQIVNGYEIVGRLGTGSFADVYKAVKSSKTIALKRFKELRLHVPDVLAEIESLKIAAHRNVVQYMESFADENTIYVVMEYCEFGDIEDYILSKKPNIKVRMGFIQDIASGIAHLHGLKISHRDLKPANILVDNRRVAKIADFGLAKILSKTEGMKSLEEMYMETMAGTYVYMAPEVPKGHYNAQADIFSMGIVFCCILDEEVKESIEKELVGLKMHVAEGYTYTVPAKVGAFMQRLITQMLQKDYHLRPKAQEISKKLMQHGQKPKDANLKSLKLLAAGMSACLGVEVRPPGEASSSSQQKIKLNDLFHFTKPVLLNENNPQSSKSKTVDKTMIVHDVSDIDILFRSVGGTTGKAKISKKASANEMRRLVASQMGIPEESIELYHRRWEVDDDHSIDKQGISQGAVIHVHSVKKDKGTAHYEMDNDLLDPSFNYDFTGIDDDKKFIRGGHEYQRPCGWFRHALKVKGQYSDDVWLGDLGTRTHSTAGEWPVSYHGSKITKDNTPIGSAQAGLQNGIITTPSLQTVAEKYAEVFEFDGKTYQIALQNRINPSSGHMVIISGDGPADYWLSPKEDPSKKVNDVRPYGILIRRISVTDD
ncbi:uncharacterized protein [Antedon mediterranea]|uniref:uncharacterized protein n=1 Tax=Antedon mediterranea TaxID=105859 RepID=UPI003AF74BE6